MITLTFPDGAKREIEQGLSAATGCREHFKITGEKGRGCGGQWRAG